MSGFTTIGDVLSKTPYVKNTKKETDMSNTIQNGTDPIIGIRNILQQPTPADMVQWKVQSVTSWGQATMVAYTDARLPRKILDEAVGIDGWETKFERDPKGNLFCYITIHFPNGRSITKGDCGVPSNFESEKGEASDAFKRACFTWGICADLYDLDIYQIECPNKGTDDHPKWDTWSLKNWKPADGQVGIKGLTNSAPAPTPAPAPAPMKDEERGHMAGDDDIPDFLNDDAIVENPNPDGQGHGNPQWMQGRNDSIGFGKNAQLPWKSIDESMLWWCVTKMNHISDKDQSNIPIQVERKRNAGKEILFRIETDEWNGTDWWGDPKQCPLNGQQLRDKINTLVKDLS
jgi:hypothetical protein